MFSPYAMLLFASMHALFLLNREMDLQLNISAYVPPQASPPQGRRRRCGAEKPENYDPPTRALITVIGDCLTDFACLRDLYNLGIHSEETKWVLRRLECICHDHYLTGSPRTELLLGLTQLNLTRALIHNIEILGYQSILMHNDALSPFCIAGPSLAGNEVMSLPVSLRPTALQLSTPHHPWLDLFPSPQMRDNLIVLEPLVDEYELCEDLCNSMEGTAGILVWKDPWDPTGWERRYGSKGLLAFSLHPGGITTGLQQHVPDEALEQGAATTVWAAVAKALEKHGGKYLDDCQIAGPHDPETGPMGAGYAPWAYDEVNATKLWDVSMKMVGLDGKN
ncbi:uncharacterized protein N7458_011882 [Penicillium daleae]|uniref:Uncharacterized protein n=1 Tax=Penicillium daleae TaxID=63821 RepID=A0AAD6BSV9_9EURO|nr:uncharacterized protein N7458_011882 [Penicillium daleae]KAJ5432726.1 hypothetical protein N7458_011882 [Penicillium daleae]